MILVHVWITLPAGEHIHVGDLLADDPDRQGVFTSEFQYSEDWLRYPGRFPLIATPDKSLSLERRRHQAKLLEPPLAVFEDALPDSWGRRLLLERLRRKTAGLTNAQSTAPYLLIELGAEGLGALSFAAESGTPAEHGLVGVEDLSVLMQAAEDFEAGKDVEDHGLRRLLAAGSTVGGARPKALVHDESGLWIAKFKSGADDMYDVVGLEAAGMLAAKDAGLDVPETRLVFMGKRKALLVKRFDVTDAGRRHMVSLRTLLGSRPGLEANSYGELATAVRFAAANPAAEVSRLFRQMVYNAAIGNTDDHTKNFWMLRDADGWRLTPAFDLVPNYQRRAEHQLAFQYEAFCPAGDTLRAVGELWGVDSPQTIVTDVIDGARALQGHARASKVPMEQVAAIAADIERRCGTLAKGLGEAPTKRRKTPA